MEATIEVWIEGYGHKVDNNYDNCDGKRKYFHISISDEEAKKFLNDPFAHLLNRLEAVISDIGKGTHEVGESRSPGYMTFCNY